MKPQTPQELNENYRYIFENMRVNGFTVLLDPEEYIAFPCHEILYLQLYMMYKKYKG